MADPGSSGLRRALARAERGVSLDAGEAEHLMASRGDDLTRLMASAARMRDAGLASAGRPGVVTYSRKVFIPLTRLCRDRCHYCTFVTAPNALRAAGHGLYLSRDEVLQIARDGAALGCKEALFTLGDQPEQRWPQAREWLEQAGYDSTLDYLRAMAIAVLEETGLLPHLNPGVMTWEQMHRLRPVAASMGLMLETSSRRLFEEPGQVHFGSPDKDPVVRMRTIDDAGRLSIPFTTGILVGIGETQAERVDSLLQIRRSAREFGHIREVIIQNFRAKPDTAAATRADADHEDYLATLAVSRLLLGPGIRIQSPPNLTDMTALGEILDAGVDDWGGISPLTPDHVNPERPWPHVGAVADITASRGMVLRERLALHPEHVRDPDVWVDHRIRRHVDALADETGLGVEERTPSGLPWQEPSDDGHRYAAFAASSSGRSDLHSAIDTEGRRTATRSDMGEVFGDWQTVGARIPAHSAPLPRMDEQVRAALSVAEQEPGALARDDQTHHALALLTASGPGLDALCALADAVRADRVGDDVTYVVNRNINFTNVCYTGCRFCAFAQRRTDADAYTLSLDEIAQRVREAVGVGATEICMQGGIHPDLPGEAYFDLARAVKSVAPQIHLHAFSAMEVVNGAARTGLSVREFLIGLREAGVDSLPGTAAEILDDDVRLVLTKGKLPAQTWIDVITTAHEIGLPTTATMMYGHVDAPTHRLTHLRVLRSIQERTHGFTEFVPLPFVHQNAPIYLAGLARPGTSLDEDRAVHAFSRLVFDGAIANIQASWVKLTPPALVHLLRGGVNDVGGTLMEETISRMAGSTQGSSRTSEDLIALAAAAGRTARQRTTLYGTVSTIAAVVMSPA